MASTNRKHGRWSRKATNMRYKNSNQRRTNKLRRITRSSGIAEARRWDKNHGAGRSDYIHR